jgi:glycosyltransferase involved in cell wall biosynthesis
MLFKRKPKPPGLSVIVVFFNMRREALRTLYSLTKKYQGLSDNNRYEVIAIDNGSSQPLSPTEVRSFGPEFSYQYVDTDNPSPCEAINRFVLDARFENVVVIIDGARILSPGIMRQSITALEMFSHPFIYTLAMHIGNKPQNYLVCEGYNQTVEDELLESIAWKSNGYILFSVSSVALSSKRGFFSRLTESNCFVIKKDDFIKMGLFQSKFKSPGGGLCNLELFNRVNGAEWAQPIMLLGEATFHQFHGGVATNVPMDQHPWDAMEREYVEIIGEQYKSIFRPPLYIGLFHEECTELYNATHHDQ